MAKQFDQISADHQRFIEAQHIFFVGSAGHESRVNISPKGMDSLRVLEPNRIIWRNLTGSGNETAGHLAQINRMTLMWCGFETRPLILRCFGTARTLHADHAEFETFNAHFPSSVGARQIYDLSVDLVQTSCGYAVPFFDYQGERDVLAKWTDEKGPEGIKEYWRDRNQQTIDGDPTFVPVSPE